MLEKNAMLVRLTIGVWSGRKHDKNVSHEAIKMFEASNNAGRFNKCLIAQEAIKNVQRVSNAARIFHYEQTLPWQDDGDRLLPAKNYFNYMERMKKLQLAFEDVVREFVAAYPDLKEQAKKSLGKMFNVEEYPDVTKIANKYRYSIIINPIPTSKNFIVDSINGELSIIKKEMDARREDILKEAIGDLWQRMHKVVEHVVEKLQDEKTIFRDSLIENVKELVELLPRLNVTNDKDLSDMAKRLEIDICNFDVEDLRADKKSRSKATNNAKKILKTMADYM